MILKRSLFNLTSKLDFKVPFWCSVTSVRNMSSEADDVIVESIGNKGILTLNRPKALNALNLSMVRKITPALKAWENEKVLVIIKGSGEKAFCSGGDIKSIVLDGLKGGKLGYDFFREEYTLNGLIGRYKIPYVALIHGIVMGGGVGLSIHAKYRVATETSLFAMPESQIGLFADVGASHALNKLKGKLGLYLALTGQRLKGSDLVKAGIATHFCKSSELKNVEQDLLNCNGGSEVDSILAKYTEKHLDQNEFALSPYIKQIDSCFSGNSIEDIIKNLENDGSKWAKDTIELLNKFSPTSLKVTLKELQLGKGKSLEECLEMEYRLAVNCLRNKDFYEGVRALLIDKDQKPKWTPDSLSKVSDEMVDGYFKKLSDDLELKHKL